MVNPDNYTFGENENTQSLEEILDESELELNTHKRIRTEFSGRTISIKKGYAKVSLTCIKEMAADAEGLIHGGFTFSAADFAAMAAINEPYTVLIGSNVKFLAPAKVGDVVVFEAKSKFEDARKREIEVKGYINDVKILEGLFTAVILEKHVFTLKKEKE